MKRLALAVLLGALAFVWALDPRLGLAHITTTNTVFFDREIVRVLEAHCVVCHSEDGPAGRLVTYEDAWLARERILSAVIAGDMPPWGAVAGYNAFANANGLTPRERQFVVSWVEGLGPRNDGDLFLNVTSPGAAEARPEARAELDEGRLGEPDLVVQIPLVVPRGEAGVARFVVDAGLTSERSLRALEYRPGNRRLVRAASFFVEGTDQWLGSWTPWYGSMELPTGVAHRLPRGTRIRVEVHYGPAPARVRDDGSLGLYFAESSTPVSVEPAELVLEAEADPAGAGERIRMHAEVTTVAETRVVALLPQLEPGVESIEVSARHPDGGTDILLFAKDIAMDWPTPYILREPASVPAGSTLRATVYVTTAEAGPGTAGFRVRVLTGR